MRLCLLDESEQAGSDGAGRKIPLSSTTMIFPHRIEKVKKDVDNKIWSCMMVGFRS
jgi:hypothetical protein